MFRTWQLKLGYAFTDRVGLNVWIPYRQVTAPKTDISKDNPSEKVRFTRHFEGLGDLILLGRVQALQPNAGRGFGLSLGLGMRLPTGDSRPDHDWASGLSRDPVLQVGSGTLDPIVAAIGSYRVGRTQAYANVIARFTGGENIHDYKYANEYQTGIGATRSVSQLFDLSLSVNSIFTSHDYDKGNQVSNTGGEWVFLAPGITLHSGDVNMNLSLQIPVYQRVNNSQLVSDYVMSVGLSCGFGTQKSESRRPKAAQASSPHVNRTEPDIQTISIGDRVSLEDNIARGKVTLFEFYSDRCRACARFEPELRTFAQTHPGVAVRKVNIGDGESEVVKQYQITGTPTLYLFDSDGKLLLRHVGADIDVIANLIP